MLLSFFPLVFLCFLVPIAFYVLVLATLNRRHKPTVVPGFWDALGLLIAVSGLLFVVGPVVMKLFLAKVMPGYPVDNQPAITWDQYLDECWLFWGLYYGIALLGSALLLWWRRRTTVIYNVDPDLFDATMAESLKGIGLEGRRVGRRWHIAPLEFGASDNAEVIVADNPEALSGNPSSPSAVEVDVEAFPSMCNVALHWKRAADPAARQQIEQVLAKKLEDATALDNPAAGWLMGACGILFGLVFLAVLIIFLNAYFPPKKW